MGDYRVTLPFEDDRLVKDRGNWAARTLYAVGDQVSQGGQSYICISRSHYSAAAFATDLAAHWVLRSTIFSDAGVTTVPDWTPSSPVKIREIRISGNNWWRSNSARTTGTGTFDATEQANWTRIT